MIIKRYIAYNNTTGRIGPDVTTRDISFMDQYDTSSTDIMQIGMDISTKGMRVNLITLELERYNPPQLPAEPPTPEDPDLVILRSGSFRNLTPSQVSQWVDNNVTDFNDVKRVLKRLIVQQSSYKRSKHKRTANRKG